VRYRSIANTDLRLSEIAFGCGGNAGLMVRGDSREQTDAVARALALGINYFDNSPDYGGGAAEENLGRTLKGLNARPLLNSKVEIRHDNLDDIAGHVVRSAEASLKRLAVDHLDVLQIHNGPAASPPKLAGKVYRQLWIEDFLRPAGAIEGLQRLIRDGKVRYVGFICRGDDGNEVRRLLDTGVFQIINVPYTLLNPTAGRARPLGLEIQRDFGGVIDDARARGIGTAIYSPLAGGILTDGHALGAVRHPLARAEDASPAGRGKSQALRMLAQDYGCTLAQFAYRFILTHAGVTTAIGGFSERSQMEEIAVVSDAAPLPPDAITRLEAFWRGNLAPSCPA
jgi:L-glyceraldehyde 3-phosphate reductase